MVGPISGGPPPKDLSRISKLSISFIDGQVCIPGKNARETRNIVELLVKKGMIEVKGDLGAFLRGVESVKEEISSARMVSLADVSKSTGIAYDITPKLAKRLAAIDRGKK